MFTNRRWRLGWALVVLLLVGSTVSACASAIPGSLAGFVVAVLLGGGLLLLGTSQTGCSRAEPCLRLAVDGDVGPCLSPLEPDAGAQPDAETDAYVGPCLSPPPPDAGAPEAPRDTYIGPCLTAPFDAGAGSTDTQVGPCLTPMIPDDAGTAPADADVTPCLSIPFASSDSDERGPRAPSPVPAGASRGATGDREAERALALAKLRETLSPELRARLDATSRTGRRS